MTLKTDKLDEALLEDIAGYFDDLAAACEAMAARGYRKREHATRAKVWREAAADVRTIKLGRAQHQARLMPNLEPRWNG